MAEFRAENEQQMKYLLGELSEPERERVEERLFDDEEYFADLLELENDLTDAYVRGELSAGEKLRFENSFEKIPERRKRLADAAAFQQFLASENRPPDAEKTEKDGFWTTVSAFFAPRSFAMQTAFAAVLILLTAATGFLIYERYRLNQELAELNENRQNEAQIRAAELEKQLAEIREREKTLQEQLSNRQTELESSQTQTEDLQKQIEQEQAEIQRLEKQLEDLRNQRQNGSPTSPNERIQPPRAVVASVVLAPVSGGKGEGDVGYLAIGNNVSSIRLSLRIEDTASKSFSVSVNDANIRSNVNLRGKTLNVSVPVNRFKFGEENRITLTGAGGEILEYRLVVERK